MSKRGAPSRCQRRVLRGILCFLAVVAAIQGRSGHAGSVTTYHYDNLRTGWNSSETTLTVKSVPSVQLLQSVALDEQVDAQPLIVNKQMIAGRGTHDVVYVVTENNTIYAIDDVSGETLLRRNLGVPVPLSMLPGGCNNNSASVGVTSTPVVDQAASVMYVMVYTLHDGAPRYRLHELDLTTLGDATRPVDVEASGPLTGGGVYNFDPAVSRQRSALLAANGNVYAAFASFCDVAANQSRGWLLGWQAGTLTPLPSNRLENELSFSANTFFLTSIWMSGYGMAADRVGNIYFATGNSDPQGTSYDAVTNLSESIVKVSPDLMTVESYFSPGGSLGVDVLDQGDSDTGSGGVLLLPDQPGYPNGLVIAAGKVGQMWLMDRENLGGHHANRNDVLATRAIGGCWCGQSYFEGPDESGRVVTSGGSKITVWKVLTSGKPELSLESQSPELESGQDPGFFTTISSNGTADPIIWAIGRPTDSNPANITLYGFDPVAAARGTSSFLFSGVAGTWPNTSANANIVPVVADGHVYVASYKQLAIFGLGLHSPSTPIATAPPPSPATEPPPGVHEVFGTIAAVNGNSLTLTTRTGIITVDAFDAVAQSMSVVLRPGEAVRILGRDNGSNVLRATSIIRAKASPRLWPADR